MATDLFTHNDPVHFQSCRCSDALNNGNKTRLSPATPILINSPPPSPTHLRTANAPNHRHARPALPPLLRRSDDGLGVAAPNASASLAKQL